MNYPSYSDSDAFYRKSVSNNQAVFDELNRVMKAGIRLVYVPGNHDMLLSSGILDEALPGIVQARDAKGLGVYYTGTNQNVAIEHGHRYDVFSAPDSLSNRAICGENTLLPAGLFLCPVCCQLGHGRPSFRTEELSGHQHCSGQNRHGPV
jgi:UDP-2,3-diacylglucosamine pyrophosphatase LpxH